MITAAIDTIAAISTPIGFGGIGIVRLSGSGSKEIAMKVFSRTSPKITNRKKTNSEPTFKDFIPRQLHYGYIVDPGDSTVFNEVLMAYMPSPNSYTREDVVEIQAHGGTASLRAILEIVIRGGARLAEPGEFTRRAYLNGRIDLSQAEATIDVIQSKTEASLRIANRNLEGDVGKSVKEIRKSLLEIQVTMEANIDFPEDVEENFHENGIRRKISYEVLAPLTAIIGGYRHGHMLREGVRLAIIGRTNVGKSSMLNQLLRRERAIVTSYPGTTRDSLEESVSIFGLPVVFVDTAGWRNTTDPVEIIGIEKTHEEMEKANIILFMVDGSRGVVPGDDDLYQKIHKKEKMLIINKRDLFDDDSRVSIPEHWQFSDVFYTSAKFGSGFEKMREQLYKRLMHNGNISEVGVIPNLRQKNLFQKAEMASKRIINGIDEQVHADLIAIDIQDATGALDEITGDTVKPDILEEIFSRFCIGK